jgi:protein-tyrosine phosphatase
MKMADTYAAAGAVSVALALALVVTGCRTGDPAASVSEPAAEPEAAEARQVPLDGQSNFRDLGGYRTSDGLTVKWGEVFRSGELHDLTDDDVARLEALGLRTVVNFLQPGEIEANGRDRLPPGTREVLLPIGGKVGEMSLQVQRSIRSGEFESLPPERNPEFHGQLILDGAQEYAALLRAAMDPENRPLVFHCSHGVHRTGTATALLLSALGVPWEQIREDYLLSNTYRAEEVEAQLERIRQAVASDRGVAPEDVDMTNVEAFFILEGYYIGGTLDQALQDHGSLAEFIRDGLGISDDEIERLRNELLE